MALRLHAITPAEGAHNAGPADGRNTGMFAAVRDDIQFIPFRDLCAVVSEQHEFQLDEASAEEVSRHRQIVDGLFRRSSVLPAPFGTVFRATDVLTRWMELHYVSLNGALQFVEDRSAARVHAVRADGRGNEDAETGSDLAAAAAEAFRALRRRSVAVVPLRLEQITGLVLSAAFLVDRDLWKDFQKAVEEQQDAHHLLRFDMTGPWAPYDFVGMRFGG